MTDDFLTAFDKLCTLHGVSTYALIVRDGENTPLIKHRAWLDYMPVDEQRAAAALIHFDLSGLAVEILAHQWHPRVDEPTPAAEEAPPGSMDTPAPHEAPERLDGPDAAAWGGDDDMELAG